MNPYETPRYPLVINVSKVEYISIAYDLRLDAASGFSDFRGSQHDGS